LGNQPRLISKVRAGAFGRRRAEDDTHLYWRLGEGVTACLAADRILFLDLERDRYHALPAPLTSDFLSWLQSPATEPPVSCRAVLLDLRLDHGDGRAVGTPRACAFPRALALDSASLPGCAVRPGDCLSVGTAVIQAWNEVRSRPLAAVLARRFARPQSRTAPAGDLKIRLARFRSARPFVPVPRVCLHDCLALLDWLGPDSAGASLVFGVCARPFSAHCWLQAGDRLLDDHPESPSRYQPILHLP